MDDYLKKINELEKKLKECGEQLNIKNRILEEMRLELINELKERMNKNDKLWRIIKKLDPKLHDQLIRNKLSLEDAINYP